MNKTEQILKAKLNKQPTKLSKEELNATLMKSMAAQLSESEQEEKEEHKAPLVPAEQPKQAPAPKQEEAPAEQQDEREEDKAAPLSKSQVESRLTRLDNAIENSNSHLMKSFLTAAREKTIRDNVPITISTNVQKSNYKYSMGDMHMMVNILEEKGYDKDTIERALLWMSSQKKE